jgi:hypothetical protein
MTRGGEVTITDSNSDPDGREGRTSARIRRPMKQAAPPSQRTQTAAADDGAATRSHRQLRRDLGRVRCNFDDEIGVQRGGDPIQERDGRNYASGFEAG